MRVLRVRSWTGEMALEAMLRFPYCALEQTASLISFPRY
jgi:hypothetical protein